MQIGCNDAGYIPFCRRLSQGSGGGTKEESRYQDRKNIPARKKIFHKISYTIINYFT